MRSSACPATELTVEEILHLAIPQPLDRRVICWAFDAAIPTAVVVGAVAIVFAIRLVVLLVIGDEVIERESIVAGHKVDALLRFRCLWPYSSGLPTIRSATRRSDPGSPRKKSRTSSRNFPFHSLPGVADETADLIEPGGVPSLGNELGARECGLRLDIPQHGWIWQRMA